MSKFNIDTRVERIKGEHYQIGKTGTIVEIDHINGRVRVLWDGDKRTWIKVSTGAIRVIPA